MGRVGSRKPGILARRVGFSWFASVSSKNLDPCATLVPQYTYDTIVQR